MRRVPHSGPSLVGRVLGRYHLRTCLGEGAFGAVFEAEDREWRQLVALKVLRNPGEAHTTLAREFRDLADVSHPNIVSMYALDVVGDQCLIAMELVPGTDLDEAPARRDPVALRALVEGLLDGLDHLHACGILHLDLKPSNVRVDAAGRPVIVDFGLAERFRVEAGTTSSEGVRGTPGFMAPEQLWGQAVSPATDMYSLGMMLHRILREDEGATRAGFDPAWKAVIHGLMAENSEQRWTSSEVRSALSLRNARRVRGLGRSPLVGRDRELAVLQRFVGSDEPEGDLLMLRGASGIGKSRLLDAVEEVVLPDAVFLRARCFENDYSSFTAFEPLAALAASTSTPSESAALARLFPLLFTDRSLSAPDLGLLEAQGCFRDALRRACKKRRVVLLVDDAQWAGPDSASMLARLMAPPSAPALRVVLALSSAAESRFAEAVTDELARLGALAPVWLDLGPLPPDHVRGVLSSVGVARSDAEIDALVAWCSGSPFLAHALSGASTAAGDPSEVVRGVIDSSIEDLPPFAHNILVAIALCNRPPSRSLVLAASRMKDGAREVFHTLQARRLLVADGPGVDASVQLSHRQLQDGVLSSLSASRSRQLHEDLAETLLARGSAEHDRIALHLFGSGRAESASEHAALAGDAERQRLGYSEAAGWYERAAAWSGDEDRSRQLLRTRAETLLDGGHTLEATAAFADAARFFVGPVRDELMRLSGHAALTGGAVEIGLSRLRAVLSNAGESHPTSSAAYGLYFALGLAKLSLRSLRPAEREASVDDRLRIDTYWSLGQGLANVRPLQAVRWVVRSVNEALRCGHARAAARGLALLGGSLAAFGRLGVYLSRRCLDGATRIAEGLGDETTGAVLPIMRSHVHALEGDWMRTESEASRGLELLGEATGMHWERTLGQCMWLFAMDQIGDMERVRDRGRALLDEGRQRGDRYAQAVGAQNEAFARLSFGEVDAAREQARWVVSRWADDGYTSQHFYSMRINLYADIFERRARHGLAEFNAERPRFAAERLESISTGRFQIGELHVRLLLADACERGYLEEAARHTIARRARGFGRERRVDGRPHEAWMMAALASFAGQRLEAEALLAEAVAGFRGAGMRLLELCCARQLATVRSGRTDDQIDHALRMLGVRAFDRWPSVLVPGRWAELYRP